MADIVKIYEKSFDAKKFFENYFLKESDVKTGEWFVDFVHKLFSEGKLSGNDLLDVGSASTIQAAMSASAYIQEIYLSDLLENNRREIEKWIRGDPDAFDHSILLKQLARLEGHNDIKILEDRIRKSIKGVLPCNVLKKNPLEPMVATFDIVVSSLVADCYSELSDYIQIYKNTSSLIRQGGYLVVAATLNGTTYSIGDVELPGPGASKAQCLSALEDAKIEVLEVVEHYLGDGANATTDSAGFMYVYGRKL